MWLLQCMMKFSLALKPLSIWKINFIYCVCICQNNIQCWWTKTGYNSSAIITMYDELLICSKTHPIIAWMFWVTTINYIYHVYRKLQMSRQYSLEAGRQICWNWNILWVILLSPKTQPMSIWMFWITIFGICECQIKLDLLLTWLKCTK